MQYTHKNPGRICLIMVVSMMTMWCWYSIRHQSPKPQDPAVMAALREERAIDSYMYYPLADNQAEDKMKMVTQWSQLVNKTSVNLGISVETLYGLICCESGGNPHAVTKRGAYGAVGIMQFMPKTARDYGLNVDLPESARLLATIKRVRLRNGRDYMNLADLRLELQFYDERFDPEKSIDAAARYYRDRLHEFGQPDFATAAHHMGTGNLTNVVFSYCQESHLSWEGNARDTIAKHDLTWIGLIDQIRPGTCPLTWEFLHKELKDESWDYYLKVMACGNAVMLWLNNKSQFRTEFAQFRDGMAHRNPRIAAELGWYPPHSDISNRWLTAADLRTSLGNGELIVPPDNPDLGFSLSQSIGARAPQYADAYKAATPHEMGLVYAITKAVREEDTGAVLQVNSLVRSLGYQALVTPGSNYSGHVAGASVDFDSPASDNAKAALEHVLIRFKLRGYIVFLHEKSGQDGEHYYVTLNPAYAAQFAAISVAMDKQLGITRVMANPNNTPWWAPIVVTLASIYALGCIVLAGFAGNLLMQGNTLKKTTGWSIISWPWLLTKAILAANRAQRGSDLPRWPTPHSHPNLRR